MLKYAGASLCKTAFISRIVTLLVIVLLSPIYAQNQAIDPTTHATKITPKAHTSALKASTPVKSAPTKDAPVIQHAHGTFTDKVTALPLYDTTSSHKLGHKAYIRHIYGDIEGISKGEMITAKTDVEGSQACASMEYVTGTLKGRKGSFTILQKGILTQHKLERELIVVPDSGTGELTGLAGTITISVVNSKHYYDFDYTLPEIKK